MRQNQLFNPSRELTFDTVNADRRRILKHLKDGAITSLRFDLSHVVLCDSAGLSLLLEAKRLCQHYNKQFDIEAMPKAIYALAEFCGVEAMLYCAPTK